MPFQRENLLGNRVYYVRSDGSDVNDGLGNSSTGAFLTIQRAVDVVATQIDPGPYAVTIQIADGTYAPVELRANLSAPSFLQGTGQFSLKGNAATPANVVVSGTSANPILAVNAGVWTVQDMALQTTTAGTCLNVQGMSFVRFQNLRFGATANAHISTRNGGVVQAGGNYAIVGGAAHHLLALNNSTILIDAVTVTLTGTPAFSSEFAQVYSGGLASVSSVTFSGAATGNRYLATGNGVIYTNSAGATYLPGNAAGSTASGGQYV